jgi:hypothetical protein
MNKILSLLFVSLTINLTPLECMQSDSSDLSSQSQVNKGDNNQVHTDEVMPVISQYLSEGRMWIDRVVQEVWDRKIQLPTQQHSVEEFIGGLVRSAREGGDKAVIAFLGEAEKWGFALDSVSYVEPPSQNKRNGSTTHSIASLNLWHLIVFNDICTYPTYDDAMKKLTSSISNIHSIICNNDVCEVSYSPGTSGFNDGLYIPFVIDLSLKLLIPLTFSKKVIVDITRQHH